MLHLPSLQDIFWERLLISCASCASQDVPSAKGTQGLPDAWPRSIHSKIVEGRVAKIYSSHYWDDHTTAARVMTRATTVACYAGAYLRLGMLYDADALEGDPPKQGLSGYYTMMRALVLRSIVVWTAQGLSGYTTLTLIRRKPLALHHTPKVGRLRILLLRGQTEILSTHTCMCGLHTLYLALTKVLSFIPIWYPLYPYDHVEVMIAAYISNGLCSELHVVANSYHLSSIILPSEASHGYPASRTNAKEQPLW